MRLSSPDAATYDGEVGNRIRELREARGMTQYDLAQLVHRRPETIQRWEAGTQVPRKKARGPLARRLGVTVADLGLDE